MNKQLVVKSMISQLIKFYFCQSFQRVIIYIINRFIYVAQYNFVKSFFKTLYHALFMTNKSFYVL